MPSTSAHNIELVRTLISQYERSSDLHAGDDLGKIMSYMSVYDRAYAAGMASALRLLVDGPFAKPQVCQDARCQGYGEKLIDGICAMDFSFRADNG